MLLCYVDHHDKAYAWAERRRIERHPRTGAAQLVEIRERVEEVPVHAEPAQVAEAKPPLFVHLSDEILLSYGVPQDWLGAVRTVVEDGLFALAEHLPREAAEALLDLAVGATPKVAEVLPAHEDAFAHPELYELFFGARPNVASAAQIENALVGAARELGEERFSRRFLLTEWQTVVDAWQLRSWVVYRDISRLGRRTRVGGKQREALWAVFERARAHLHERNAMTWADILGRVTDHITGRADKPFTYVVADEAQDLAVPQLRMLAALVPDQPEALFFAGDLGQRIFQHPFSRLSLGIDVRGRSFSLKVNYRTSHQIRRRVDVLLPRQIRDVDGYEDSRAATISVFEGPEPVIRTFEDEAGEIAFVGEWLRSVLDGGVRPEEVGVFVRTEEQLSRARRAVKAAAQEPLTLTDKPQAEGGRVLIGTMHLAKGLEFKVVAVMARDDDVLPLPSRTRAGQRRSGA